MLILKDIKAAVEVLDNAEKLEAIEKIKGAIVKSYSHKGDKVVQMNFNAVDKSLENLQKVDYPQSITNNNELIENNEL